MYTYNTVLRSLTFYLGYAYMSDGAYSSMRLVDVRKLAMYGRKPKTKVGKWMEQEEVVCACVWTYAEKERRTDATTHSSPE